MNEAAAEPTGGVDLVLRPGQEVLVQPEDVLPTFTNATGNDVPDFIHPRPRRWSTPTSSPVGSATTTPGVDPDAAAQGRRLRRLRRTGRPPAGCVKLLIDEQTPIQYRDVLAFLLPHHGVAHANDLRWKTNPPVRDPSRAISRPPHPHLPLAHLGLAPGAVAAAMPMVMNELAATASQG